MSVRETGEITRLHLLINTQLLYQVFSFKQQLYVTGQSENDGTSMVARMDSQTGALTVQFRSNQFYFIRTTGQYIIALSTTPTISPVIELAWFLDENLQHDTS